jgi:hypothetical protein
MTDWDLMAEQIHRAMQMVNKAQQASEKLATKPNEENLSVFQDNMRRLQNELCSMQWALEHPGQYSMDEVIAELNRLLSGKTAAYRSSKPISTEDKAEKS